MNKELINECQQCGNTTEENKCIKCKTSKFLIKKEREETNEEITEFVL